MGTSENIQLIPVEFGSYSADAILGKAKGLSPDSMNMRYDLFNGIESILGNTAYTSNACAGSANLGGDVFQYIHKDGTFDVILGRQKAEGKVYKVPSAVNTNTLSTPANWNAGTPTSGDNLLLTTGALQQKNLTFGSATPSVILNPDFESSFTNWTVVGGGWQVTSNAGVPESGTKCAACLTNTFSVTITDSVGGILANYISFDMSWTWHNYTLPASDLIPFIGTSIVVSFRMRNGIGPIKYLNSDAFTYQGDNISFYLRLYDGALGLVYTCIDNITLSYGAVVASVDYGIVPTTLGNLTISTVLNYNDITFQVSTSTDNWSTSTSYVTVINQDNTSGGNATLALGGITPARYVKVRAIPTKITGNGGVTISNVYIGGQWVSATQDLGSTPSAWGAFVPVLSENSQTLSFEFDTSVDGTNWDGFISVIAGSIPSNTPTRRYIRYRVTFNTIDYTLIPTLTKIVFTYTPDGGALVQLTGWTGTGYNSYFNVLNNLLIISDETVSPMSWTGTGTAFASITGPSAAYPEVHYSRYFLAYSVANPSRIWWSAIYDPTTWNLGARGQWIDVNPDDGDQITGIKSYGGVLYVFKHRHVYMIQGNDFDPITGNFSLQSMPQLPGTESHNSIVVGTDGQMYWYGIKGMIQFNGSSTPNFIGRGYIDKTVQPYRQNLTNYNLINAVEFASYNEIWFSFGHTIYTFNYAVNKWGRIFFDNSVTGNNVYSLATYIDSTYNNILSFTGQNVIEQWQDSPTFYAGMTSTTSAIQSYFTTDFLDGDWYYNKNYFRVLLSIEQLTASTISLSHYIDFSTTAIATVSISCPTSLLPDQYSPVPLAGTNGKRIQLKLSCSALQFGISDMTLQAEVVDSGRI